MRALPWSKADADATLAETQAWKTLPIDDDERAKLQAIIRGGVMAGGGNGSADAAPVRDRARELLLGLVDADAAAVSEAMQPRDEDYARVFVGDAAEAARRGYAPFWLDPSAPLNKPEQTDVITLAAPAALIAGDPRVAREFPGGYEKIATLLEPTRIWVKFKFVAPGASTGMAYDGLVWVDDHWAWFPKPWRVLG